MKKKPYWKLTALFCLTFLLLLAPMTAYARAGGGGSGSGGGGGGGSSSSFGSSSHDNTHYYSNGRTTSNPISRILFYGILVCMTGGSTIVFFYRRQKARLISKRRINEFAKYGYNWDFKEVQKRVEHAYFEIQECWRRQDADYAAEYLSDSLREEFRMKLEWMDARGEQVVQKNVRLLSADPVYVEDQEGTEQDMLWYLIHGRMIGYYINKDTEQCVRGNPNAESFYEYWLFIYQNGKWVLNEIKQKDEIDIRQFSHM